MSLITDSSLPDEHYVREAAIAGIALDALIGHDSYFAENAVDWARAMMDAYESAPHSGDCTKEAHTCLRCFCDNAKREATEQHDA